ncbi:hypothetical protein TNCV_3022171 [Trichonephila clavipes]|nr:hypothetical protein TNCV_3022171 [Trichonephila clavipes]
MSTILVTVVIRMGTTVAWGPCIIGTADTVVAMYLTKQTIWLNTVEVEDESHGVEDESHGVEDESHGVEDESHEVEDNDESEELVGDLDKALDLEFKSGTSPNDRDKAFLRRRGINIKLFTLRREHRDFERKTSETLDEKN